MRRRNLLRAMVMMAVCVLLPSCGMESGGSSHSGDSYSGSYNDSEEYESYTLAFNNSHDVYNYINGKTFSGDGMNIRFYNNGQSVDVNGSNIANDVKIYGIGVNDNNVAYATIQISNPAGITTTFSLLAVDGHAQLIDPNDGAVYEY